MMGDGVDVWGGGGASTYKLLTTGGWWCGVGAVRCGRIERAQPNEDVV